MCHLDADMLQRTNFVLSMRADDHRLGCVGENFVAKAAKKNKLLTELEACDCRWPIGDPRHAEFHFCGAQQVLGRPYCEFHWRLSFTPSKPRQQQNRTAPLPITRAA
jgi:hypothetical protein